MAGDLVISTINGGPLSGMRNAIINGNFGINQRGVSGTVSLSAGAYGHDRWKAGASGCTYTFATSENVTTLTISAGSLIQVIEGLNLNSGTYTLSWTGTAQGKIGAGSYAGSGVTGTATGGTNLNIEFGTGTLSLVQFEPGSVATEFERRPYGTELALCQRYYQQLGNSSYVAIGCGRITSGRTTTQVYVGTKTNMRAAPTLSYSNLIVTDREVYDLDITGIADSATSISGAYVSVSHTAVGTSGGPQLLCVKNGTTGYLALTAEL